MTVEVVPVTRLRRDTSTWSYRVPPKSSVQPGCLVVIPFRNHPTLGMVWEVHEEDARATQTVQEVLSTVPLLRAPHRDFVGWLAEEGLCSLSTALYTWLPRGLRSLPLSSTARRLLKEHNQTTLSASEINITKQHAILVPSRRPQQEAALSKRFGDQFSVLFSDSSIGVELERWFAIAQGKLQVGLGGVGSLWAPWLNLRHITIVDPEDIAHYHEQVPYLSLVGASQKLAQLTRAEVGYRTHLPSSVGATLWGGSALGVDTLPTPLRITDLTREPLLNESLILEIQTTLQQEKQVLILYNAHDSLRPIITDGREQRKLFPGIESIGRDLARLLGCPQLPPSVHLGTRSILGNHLKGVGLTVALNVDRLTENPLFADQLHGWSDLGGLFSYSCPCTVQTHHPEHPLIWSLANSSFTTYLSQRIVQRAENGLPPFCTQIVCSVTTGESTGEQAQALYEKLHPLVTTPWQLSHPFPGPWRKREYTHLLLQAPAGTRLPVTLRTVLSALPAPWKVQRDPWHVM